MPIDKIESRSEAAKAFRDGAYFKVGDRFISPDEIVTARRDGSGNPVFELTTGDEVQHSEFADGSTGHFLFEQLQKVEGRYVETIKPEFNVVMAGDPKDGILDPQGTSLASLDTAPTYSHFDPEAGKAFGHEFGGNVKIYDYNTQSMTTVDPSIGDTVDRCRPVPDVQTQTLYVTYLDNANADVSLVKMDYDGGNKSLVLRDFATGVTPSQIDLDPNAGLVFHGGASELYKIPTNGDPATLIASTNDLTGTVAADTKNKRVFDSQNGRLLGFDYLGNQEVNKTNVRKIGDQGLSFFDGNLFYVDTQADVIVQGSPTMTDEKEVLNVPDQLEEIDVGLDLSLL